MKLFLTIFIIISLTLKIHAQVVFCPAGAEWNYIFSNGFGPGKANEKIKYTHDSIVDGVLAKVLNHKIFFSYYAEHSNPTLIRQVGDTIFMRNAKTQHAWQILYNFNALPGQSWYNSILVGVQPNNAIVNYTITVDSVSLVVDNGFNLKRLYVRYYSSYGNNGLYYKGPITERLGCDEFLFNFKNLAWSDGDFVTEFLCYKDLSFGLKQFTALACDFSNPVGIEKISSLFIFKTYPNPISDFLNIDLEISPAEMELSILDLQGREIKKFVLQQKNKIGLSDLKEGMYFVSIAKNQQEIYKSKLIKTGQ